MFAIKEACVFVVGCGFHDGIIETDSLQSVNLIIESLEPRMPECFTLGSVRIELGIYMDLAVLPVFFLQGLVMFVSRKLAKFSLSISNACIWLKESPLWLKV